MKIGLEKLGLTLAQGGLHAGFLETAMLLNSSNNFWVDMQKAQTGFMGNAWARVKELAAFGEWNISDISSIGVIGDPVGANEKAGQVLLDHLVEAFLDIINEALE